MFTSPFSCKLISYIEKILQDVGLNYIWLNNDVTNVNWLCTEVQKRLQLQFIQNWHSNIQESPKYLNYRIFKTEFTTELYITKLQPNFYIPLARFRTKITDFRLKRAGGKILIDLKDFVLCVIILFLEMNFTLYIYIYIYTCSNVSFSKT